MNSEILKVYMINSIYYKCSNPDIGSIEQELIKMLEHEVYTFYINL